MDWSDVDQWEVINETRDNTKNNKSKQITHSTGQSLNDKDPDTQNALNNDNSSEHCQADSYFDSSEKSDNVYTTFKVKTMTNNLEKN